MITGARSETMEQEEAKRPVRVSRQELYRQVWETPMMRLGKQYGISGNGLKKICNRLKIPYPSPGYWAKLQFGKRVKVTPLPESDVRTRQEVTVTPTPPLARTKEPPGLEPELAEKLAKASASTSGITVPESLRNPHPSIAAWIADHKRSMEEDRRNSWRWGTRVQTKPFTELERREQRFLNTLYKELEKRGFKIRGQAPYSVSVEIGQDKVEFAIRERIRQIRRPLNDEEKASVFNRNQQWRQEQLPTGELIFALKTRLGAGLAHEWRDGDRQLEDRIGEIVAVLSLAGPILEDQRRQAEEAERRRWQEEQKREEERQRQRLEQNRWRRFVELAELWEEAVLVSKFIEMLEKLPVDAENSYAGRTVAEWLAWSRERRDLRDPTRWSPGYVWADLAEVSSWQYPD